MQARGVTPTEFLARIKHLPAWMPIEDELADVLARIRANQMAAKEGRDKDEIYADLTLFKFTWLKRLTGLLSEKRHLCRWVRGYDGPGGYGRKAGTARSAKLIWNRAVNVQMIFWLAAALKLPEPLLRKAISEIATKETMMAQAAAFRRYVPWEMIEQHLPEPRQGFLGFSGRSATPK
jgi:hypothetical protein